MRYRLLAAGAAAVLLLAACSDGGREEEPDASGGSAKQPTGYTIAFVTHETPGDTFWDKVRAGAEQAATDTGVELKYSNDPDAGKQATLIQQAVDSKVQGIATTLVTPDALAGSVKAATGAGIPVVGLNAGIDQYKSLGALMYFGSDETLAGESIGERIAAAGGKHPICVIHQQGSVSLEARCAGVKSKVAGTENLQVNGADDAAVTTALQAKLAQDKTIDYIVTLGAPIALDAIQAKEQAASQAKLVSFDLNKEMAQAVKDGKVEFAVDQQPYAQGYMAVTSLYLYIKNGNDLGGGGPVLTGPSFVDSSNIDKILPFTEKNTR
ncbi:putative ABC transporter substrate-binding protein [Actinoplanes missouriensis 431]|uniref:Putative ABC transporter substrate-binding protein n=1 Tax=Actinoplanes missouriensis (strain ATCC 14538 / DSM 43046 / CBS 188.64 / JCM 3121 / NBRC 102363 / NCIMB 12654 / NRRL B-3342 / UNCC 431) TaxID=512565 RepID=I0HAP1_ACTM4|nr:sugar ABC transporter substrate-binding protein [Actinoplanes missouriensis]BAL90078.1 putative ABC transporter substrate-binding protein [Actinoplanes missouriensis 431]